MLKLKYGSVLGFGKTANGSFISSQFEQWKSGSKTLISKSQRVCSCPAACGHAVLLRQSIRVSVRRRQHYEYIALLYGYSKSFSPNTSNPLPYSVVSG